MPLTRAWCLFELYCSVDTGASFGVCLGEAEQQALEKALFEDAKAVINAFASIDVAKSEAGDPDDLARGLNQNLAPCPGLPSFPVLV